MTAEGAGTAREVVSLGGSVVVRRRRELPLRPGELRIEVAYVGICGSEVHFFRPRPGEPEPVDGAVLGHEYSGRVVEVGEGVDEAWLGRPVVGLPRVPCHVCRSCRRGRPVDCLNFLRPENGAWADTIALDERLALPLPDGAPLRQAALLEPLACSLRALEHARPFPGHSAFVIGGGPIGLLLAALSLRNGARVVILSEPVESRRALAARLGAFVVDPGTSDPVRAVHEITGGDGADIVYEAVGLAPTVEQALAACGLGGTAVIAGVASPSAVAAVSPWEVFSRELTLVGAWGIETTLLHALGYLPLPELDLIATHEFALDAAAEALAAAFAGDGGKILLRGRGAEVA
jgi:threonine dehydrogenase-like Zn-dependent dehydrogenase